MTWTTPETYIAETVLTAAQLNVALRDNMLQTEAAKAETRGGIFTQNYAGDDRVRVSYPMQSFVDTPNMYFDAQLADDVFVVGPPYVTVPRAEHYHIEYSARQHRTAGTARVWFQPYMIGVGENISNLRMYSNSDSGYRTTGYAIFEATEISELTELTYTFGMAYGTTGATTAGQWAQRNLSILPIGPVPEELV